MDREIKKIIYILGFAALLSIIFLKALYSFDKSYYKNEIRRDSIKQSYRMQKTQELKNSEVELGKSLIDVHGARVRLEEYILRPRADQVKIIAISKRTERLDYTYFLYTFNRDLPLDFSSAAKEGLKWSWQEAPSYWLTEYESKQSNNTDYIKNTATGGNYESSLTDGFQQYFTNLKLMLNDDNNIKEENVYSPVTKETTYFYYVSGVRTEVKSWEFIWDAVNNVWTQKAYDGNFVNGNPTGTLIATLDYYPSFDKLQYKMTTTYSDGKFLSRENYIINDKGEICDIPNVWTENYIKQIVNTGNFETITKASEFSGRYIDIIWAPKILLDGGLAGIGE